MYQYMMYTLAMWNSYLFVSALDIFVVVLAGLISIFSARRSQKAIEKASKCAYLNQMPALLHFTNMHVGIHLLAFQQCVSARCDALACPFLLWLAQLRREPGSV